MVHQTLASLWILMALYNLRGAIRNADRRKTYLFGFIWAAFTAYHLHPLS